MSSSAPIQISVTDPVKIGNYVRYAYILKLQHTSFDAHKIVVKIVFVLIHVFKTFCSYKIHSSTTRTGFASGSRTVDRRYNDFAWLSTELSREFPGVIVPPLPEKQALGRFSNEFVEARRRALEKFLERVASHHELGTSASFAAFLQQSDEAQLKEYMNTLKMQSKSGSGGWLDGVGLTNSKVCLRMMKNYTEASLQ